jgi:nicotinamide-nucleotide amidase
MAIEHDVAQLLTDRNLRLAVAEATCGGFLCARLASVPGSSRFFDRGVIAYSRPAKKELLGIDDEALSEHGSVSRETAMAMATGVRERSGADLGLAETGIAGPIGGRSPKPIGTCFIAVATVNDLACEEHVFAGDRAAIREAIVLRALQMVIRVIDEKTIGESP